MVETEPIICLVGPTASGKTALSQELALAIDAEVVSADSMQVYRGMDIGTGKITPSEQKVAHHCIDLVDPGAPYSAALFQEDARKSFADISGRGKRIILCGGTGFYVRAAIDDYRFPKGEQEDNPIRKAWRDYADENGNQALWQQLCNVDPDSAQLIAPNDVKRVIRAFELIEDGTSYAEQRRKLDSIEQLYPAVFIGMNVDREVLVKRIDARVDDMLQRGLVQEVKKLLDAGFRKGVTSPQAIGYKEIVRYLDSECTLEEASEEVKLATRRYAKRQRTWFRKDKRIRWIDANRLSLDELKANALDIFYSSASRCNDTKL